ncbi:hypothetical protein PT974_11056 [Cladobotryum mycophilum]|uniref:Xylanolytic transcriptional activator regulatory domain-containing protein n=1 Tax=Cladobotryum mycophilum TaxID=491253 RepID=A0ABR0SBI7_9HYPO
MSVYISAPRVFGPVAAVRETPGPYEIPWHCCFVRLLIFSSDSSHSLANTQAPGPSKKASQISAARQGLLESTLPRQVEGIVTASSSPRTVIAATAAAATPSPTAKLAGSDYYLHLAEKLLITSEPQKQNAQTAKPRQSIAGTLVLQQLILQRNPGSPGSVLALVDNERWLGITAAYEEEVGLQSSRCTAGGSPPRENDGSDQERVEDIAILVLAIVSLLTDPDVTRVADSWAEKTYAAVCTRTQLKFDVDIADLSVCILVCIYFFLTDRETLAWRGIGNVLRLLVEQSSRNSNAQSPQPQNRDPLRADKFFWTVFTLDRRWSFGTGLPFSVHDTEIDRHPLLAEDSPSSAYLKNMITYCRIASDVRKWLLESTSSLASSFDSTRDFLDFRVEQWRRNLPAGLHFKGVDDMFQPAKENRGDYRIRLTLHLRANQMRIIIHRKSAVRTGTNGFDSSTINMLADITHDTIRILVRLAHDTDIYQAQHKTFNHFLETALSSLLLILGSISDDTSRALCMKGAYDALDLIQQLSTKSPISQRLSEKFHGIQEVMNQFRDKNNKRSKATQSIEQPLAASQQSAGTPAGPSSRVVLANGFGRGHASGLNGRQEVTTLPDQLLTGDSAVLTPGLDRTKSEESQESNTFSAFPQSGDICPGLTPDTVASNVTYPQIYPSTSDAPPNTSQAFVTSNSMVYPTNEFNPAYFPDLGDVLNFYETSFFF